MISPDMNVRHPLYPELGIGKVLHVTASSSPTAEVDWADVSQVSRHAVSVLRQFGMSGLDPREAIANVAGVCAFASRHAAPHDHTQCLLEADVLIASLALAGYRIVGITDLANIQEASA